MVVYPGEPYGMPGSVDFLDGTMGILLGIYLFFMFLVLAVGVVFYVLQAISFYTIAKRRGIRNPWLAWIPVGCNWILGSISDQYQYVKKGKVKNHRKILLGLTIASVVSSLLYSVVTIAMTFFAGLNGSGEVGLLVMVMLLYMLLETALAISLCVFVYICLYDLYASCDPSNALLYLLLSIFVGVTMPFFLFSCRNKEEGMPPRRSQIPQQPAAPQPHPEWVQQQTAPRYDPNWKPDHDPVVYPAEPAQEQTEVLTQQEPVVAQLPTEETEDE